MGKALSFSLTNENSCSGPKTSRVLYVSVPLSVYLVLKFEYKCTVNFKYDCCNTVHLIIWCHIGVGRIKYRPNDRFAYNEAVDVS